MIKNVFLGLLILFPISSYSASVEKRSLENNQIALIQYDADRNFSNYDLNQKNLTDFALAAVENKAKIIVFPEGSLYGYASTDRSHEWCLDISTAAGCLDVNLAAELIPGGRSTSYWGTFATDHQVYVLFNIPERTNAGHYYNTTVAVGPSGYIGKYSKRELYSTDKYYATAGGSEFILETPFGNFGILICLDASDPGHLENYDKKVDAVILLMDWDDDPNGKYGAKSFFERRSSESGLTIYASDMSSWDGTGKYLPGYLRERNGLSPTAIGIDGISYHQLPYLISTSSNERIQF